MKLYKSNVHRLKTICVVAGMMFMKFGFTQQGQILNFEKLTINDGLSQGFVYNIAQDEKGFIWFCTPDGLNRYDGYNLKIYRHDAADSFSLSSSFAVKFFTDTHHNAWVITHDNGLNLFDQKYQKFYHLFPGIPVDDIAEDKYGNLIIATGNKIVLCKIKIEGEQHKNISVDTSVCVLSFTITNNGFRYYNISSDAAKNIFITTISNILKLEYNKQANRVYIKNCYTFPNSETGMPRMFQNITTLKYYTKTYNDIYEFADTNFSKPVLIPVKTNNQMFLAGNENVWYQSQEGKMFILNLKTKTTTAVFTKSADIDNLLKAFYCSFEDRNGNLWIGTSGLGILKFTRELNIFHQLLPGEYIYHIPRYDKNTVLIEGKFKATFNNDYTVQLDTIMLPGRKKNIYDPIKIYEIDDRHNYWFLLNDKLYNYNVASAQLNTISIKNKLGSRFKLLTEKINDDYKSNYLTFDRHNNLWFQCYNNIMSYNIDTDSLKVYTQLPPFKDDDMNFRVWYEDTNGIFWITMSRNFYSYDPTSGQTKFYQYTPGDIASAAGSNICCFCDDPVNPSRLIWIGTRGNGVCRLDKITGKCTWFNTKNGLPNNVIYGLLSDNKGNIWGSTNNGLFRLDVTTHNVKSFNATDGLQGNEFNRFAFLKLENGIMLFGGLNGLNYFKPEDIHAIKPPQVLLINIKLFNKDISSNDADALTNVDVSYLKTLSIKSNQNVISFEFAALDYKKTGAVYYRYKLNGFDNLWHTSGLLNTATYTNLNPGSYELFVQASNDNVTWSNNNLLQIQVLPMWWQTWLFKIAVAACLLAVTYAAYRYRLKTLLRVEKVRNNIAKDLHDEIGSVLSSISIYSKVAQRHLNTKEANPDTLLHKISENADQVMESMHDIVWNVNAVNDVFENIFYKMREHATQLLESKNYTVHFYFDETLNHTKLDMQSRRHFYLIYKEALNNITKYANGNNVWISLLQKNKSICLDIKDDGQGFDINKKTAGNGLLNMHSRAEALHGDIAVESKQGAGTRVQLIFHPNT